MIENGEIDNNWLSIPLGFSVFLVQEEASLEKGLDAHLKGCDGVLTNLKMI